MKQLTIIGASGHGKVVADIARLIGYESIVFLDDNNSITTCGHYAVIGSSNLSSEMDGDFIVAIGNSIIRERIQQQLLNAGKRLATLIHPAAVISEDVNICQGTVVMAGAVINAGTVIGQGCIINTGSSVDHDCRLSDYVHISVGAHLAGTVAVDTHTWVGIGACVSNNISVCRDCMIGAGAVVVKDIVVSGTYIGIPAKRIET